MLMHLSPIKLNSESLILAKLPERSIASLPISLNFKLFKVTFEKSESIASARTFSNKEFETDTLSHLKKLI